MRVAAGLCLLTLLTWFAGCSSPLIKPADTSPARAAVVSAAGSQVGAPYKFEGTGRTGFDAGGLVYYSYQQSGFEIPRNAQDQLRAGEAVVFFEKQPADLMFYRLGASQSGNENGLHVGIYIGNGQMVHAPLDRDKVVLETIDTPYWMQRLVGVAKLLP